LQPVDVSGQNRQRLSVVVAEVALGAPDDDGLPLAREIRQPRGDAVPRLASSSRHVTCASSPAAA
jgi:hypothetical protein